MPTFVKLFLLILVFVISC